MVTTSRTRLHAVIAAGALVAAIVMLAPQAARAQTGTIAGQARDATGQVLAGVQVQADGATLIEGSRETMTDDRGLFRIPALPVGRYRLRFTRAGFTPVGRENIDVTSEFTASVIVDMAVGPIEQTLLVSADTPAVDLHSARMQATYRGTDIADLPTTRDVPGLLLLSPAVTIDRRICNGGIGLFCFPTVPAFNAHTAPGDLAGGLTQGRVLVDGMAINGGRVGFELGAADGLTLDTANIQEVSFTLSGGLGESETGGATLNIVPRIGGNRFAGSYFTSYLHPRFFDRNQSTHAIEKPYVQEYIRDYDVNGSFGGPLIRNRLWFHTYVGNRGTEQYPSFGATPGYANLNEGKFAANYVPDRARGRMTMRNEYVKANARLTYQATRRNKFNIYWDEQSSCANPCYGQVLVMISPEAYWSRQTFPNRLTQLSWTNPLTNRMLLEAGVSYVSTHEDTTKHREFPNYRSIPRVCETGFTVGRDEIAVRTPAEGFGLNTSSGLGSCKTEAINSGSLNYAFGTVSNPDLNGLGPSAIVNHDTIRSRASASYVTGSHHARVGFDGVYFAEQTRNEVNDLRLNYHYQTPVVTGIWNPATRTGNCLAAPGTDPYACGNMTLYHGEDADNRIMLRPRPVGFEMNTGVGLLDERVWSGALYVQDQWTLGRFSLSGALRYDHAESRYGASCIGPDLYVPIQEDGSRAWCSTPSKGVRYNDLTPRWGVVWDPFGTGNTAIKWSMGKYLQGAALDGLFVDDNPARRATSALTRAWDDLNGNRIIDCDLSEATAHTSRGDSCGAMLGTNGQPSDAFLTFGRPASASLTPNVVCGRTARAPAALQAYCDEAGQNLMSGWGKRRHEWQLALGVQHQLLQGLVGEVTFHRRKYGNLTATDAVGVGCDYYGARAAVEDYRTCASRYLNYESDLYDFYQFTAPTDPRLPGGGGYVIRGLANQKAVGVLPAGFGSATVVRDDLAYAWNGIDTNLTIRLPGGLRASGGTSTGHATRDACFTDIDRPNVKGREGNDYGGGCRPRSALQTNVRANASYTIPWVDVLVGTVYQYRPGSQRNANFSVFSDWVTWQTSAETRSGAQFNTASGNTNRAGTNLLDAGDLYHEAVHLWDMKVAKTFRFAGRRLNIGVDVFNALNNDAVLFSNPNYQVTRLADGTFVEDNPATANVEVNPWGRPLDILTPRHLKFSVQFDF